MSRPEDIPQDIFEVASRIAEDMPAKVGPFTREFAANVIARAIMAERARCAKIAADFPNMGAAMGREIAAVIRAGR